MRIAVNIGDGLQGRYYVSLLIEGQISHQFLLLMNESFNINDLPLNVESKLLDSGSDNLLRRLLKEWQADLLVNMNTSCNIKTKVPQIMYVPDLAFVDYSKSYSWKGKILQRYYLPKYFQKAGMIITPSEFVKEEIISRFKIDAGKIQVITKSARPTFSPLDWEERNTVKDGYADGREYFLFVGGFDPVKNLMNVLKAFSQFKKWQQSDMKLLITGKTNVNREMLQKIQTFKFRDDVVVLDHVSEAQLTKLMASAYALLYPSFYEGFGLPILEAMQSGTPVITSINSAMKETGSEAVLYVDPENESEIAAQMIKLYKDEALRERLIELGKAQAAKYNEESSIDSFWKVIESVAN